MSKKLDNLIREHVLATLSEETQRLARLAWWDLMFGPMGPTDDDGKPWPGFSVAVDTIRAELEAGELWVDDDAGLVLTSEPEGFQDGDEWIEPSWEDYTHYSRREVMRATFGELAEHVS